VNKTKVPAAKANNKLAKSLLKVSNGLSVLLSIILVTILVLFSVGVTTMVTDATRQGSNVKQGTTAYYAAESGLEQALWINRYLTTIGSQVGAETNGTASDTSTNSSTTFEVQGLLFNSADPTQNLKDKTINKQFIVPFPWTGNVPWHGDGSVLGTGGCNPDSPPVPGPDSPNRSFTFGGTVYAAIEHPCNWGKLAVGEKASIPLYGIYQPKYPPQNFPDFVIRLRAPCANGKEFCAPTQRMELNCWDKGSGEKRCVTGPHSAKNGQCGEVVALWQINADRVYSSTPPYCSAAAPCKVSLKPFEDVFNGGYYNSSDTQLYENKINNAKSSSSSYGPFVVLSTQGDPSPNSGSPQGVDISKDLTQTITNFFASSSYIRNPVLTLSVVSSLAGCYSPDGGSGNDCNTYQSYNDPSLPTYDGPHMIPYLEYQVIVLDPYASYYAEVGKDNIITAEGQAGPFVQKIQVKVPNDNATLDYVIQQ